MEGKGTALAVKPGQAGGNYSRRFDTVVGTSVRGKGDGSIDVRIPGHERATASRTEIVYEALLPFQSLAKDMAQPGALAAVDEEAKKGCWGPRYSDHPVRLDHPDSTVVPLALYIDGVAYGFAQKEKATGFWIVNISTNQRYLVLCLRDRWKCRCGCGGWDSYFSAFVFVSWVLEVLQSGVYPTCQPDGTDWPVGSDELGLAGQPLFFAPYFI